MAKGDIKERIHDYILEATLSEDGALNNETLLFEEGIFDSMGLLLLIEFLQEEFDVETNDDELTIENFDSINSIVEFISSKKRDVVV